MRRGRGSLRERLNPMAPLRTLALGMSALLCLGAASAAELDVVVFDLQSGTIPGVLPFDVPFLVEAVAPAGSVAVEGQLDEAESADASFPELWTPAEPMRSTVGRDGTFRMRVPALDANRFFRFRFVVERRLTSAQSLELRRELQALLERHLSEGGGEDEVSLARASAMRDEIRVALERALNEGLPIATRGDAIELDAPAGSIFLDDLEASDVRARIEELTEGVRTRQAERETALGLYLETVPDLESELAAISASSALTALLAALQQRPDLDPRNPRNELHLVDDAARFVDLSSAERLAVARGQSQSERPVDLTDTFSADEADRFRARYLRTARALRELREWLESLVTPGTRYRTIVEERLVNVGAITADQLESLRALANPSGGAIRLAERWAETLEIYVYDLERALSARERALEDLVARIDAQAAATVIRQTSVSDVLSTRANIYVGLDLGVLYSFEVERAAAYFGANIYFAPVNKKASLSERGGFKKRVSLTVGISVTDLGLEDDERIEPLLGGGSNLVLGGGYRLARSVRVSGGVLMVLKNDPNPLVTDRSLAVTPYVAFSFDADLIGALRTLTR